MHRWPGSMAWLTAAFVVLVLSSATAMAGMPVAFANEVLHEVASGRLRAISFFLVLFLVVTWLFQQLWNFTRRDFVRLPRLSYPRALAVMAVWGALFVLVLTMIAGARELMTPGAWERDGATYRVRANP